MREKFTKCLLGVLIIFPTLFLNAQEVMVTGKVTDDAGVPLPGVNVIEAGTTNGTSTDFDGLYSINVATGSSLEFTYVGFRKQTVEVNSQEPINIQMVSDASELDEVVVVGYGTQNKSDVTGSISSVKVEEINQVPVTNAKSFLVGRTAGVIASQSPGLPGQDNFNLSIRGFGNPLVIVDGVESFMDRIDPNDIETISVLKDASAAIYGARAGSGVILITTKRGSAGKMSVNYHGYTGFQKPTVYPETSDATSYIKLARTALINDGQDPNSQPEFSLDRLARYESGELESYDWVDDLFKSSGGIIASHNVSANGGSEKIRFYSSLGYTEQNSIINGDFDYKKLTLTNNMDINLTDDLTINITTSYINEDRDYARYSPGEILYDLRTAQPFFPTTLPDPDRAPFSGFTQRSPRARSLKKFSGFDYTRLQTLAGALQVEYRLPGVPGLTLGLKANARLREIYSETLTKSYDVFEYAPDTDSYLFRGTQSALTSFEKGYSSSARDPKTRMLYRGYIDYKNTFGSHKIGALAFVEKEDNEINSLFAQRRDLLSDDVQQISAGDDLLTTTYGNGVPLSYTRLSLAGRLNYGYKNKYLVEATVRADASSFFPEAIRWGYFPSVSVGWNIHKEAFLEQNNTINNLKLRLSYSETGKDDNISPTSFDYLTGYSETGGIYYLNGNAIPQIQTEGLVNPLLTWEEITMYNAGLDFGFLKNKLYGNVDVFYRLRDGLLAQPLESYPSTFGANLPAININSTIDRGFDAMLGYRNQFGDFSFDVAGTFTFSRRKYENWQQNIDLSDPNQVRIDQLEGNYVNRTFGYLTDGLFNSQAEVDDYIANTAIQGGGAPQPGDIRYVDVSGPDGTPDGVLDRYDQRQIGFGSQPDINFGLSANISYKNFSLSTLWQGGAMYNLNIDGFFRAPFFNQQVPLTLHEKYSWMPDPENPSTTITPNAQLPAFTQNGLRDWNNRSSDFWVKDVHYVRLKTATLNYSFSSTVLDKINMKSLNIYLTGDNLFTFSNLGIFKDAIDPEQQINQNNGNFTLPILRSFTLGVKVGL